MHHRQYNLVTPPIAADIHHEREDDRNVQDAGIAVNLREYETHRDDEQKEHGEEKPCLGYIVLLLGVDGSHLFKFNLKMQYEEKKQKYCNNNNE